MKISEKIKTFFEPLTTDEYKDLESDILEHGCREPLVVWAEKDTLLDGHHRKEICDKYGIKYQTKSYAFATDELAYNWMAKNQRGRRSHTKARRIEIQLKLQDMFLKGKGEERKLRKPTGSNSVCVTSRTQNEPRRDVAIAKSAGVGEQSVHRMRVILNEADEQAKQDVKKGVVSINAAYNKIKKPTTKKESTVKAKTIHKDRLGNTIEDESLRVAFETARELDGLRGELFALKKKARALCNVRGGEYLSDRNMIRLINSVSMEIKEASPYCLVPPSHTGASQMVQDMGFLTKRQYDDLPEKNKMFHREAIQSF